MQEVREEKYPKNVKIEILEIIIELRRRVRSKEKGVFALLFKEKCTTLLNAAPPPPSLHSATSLGLDLTDKQPIKKSKVVKLLVVRLEIIPSSQTNNLTPLSSVWDQICYSYLFAI